ncbi:zinc finger protein ZNF780A [Culex quinquefasciatus]|uniref:Zinc finger protein ZNF780A n=1 Tax=Culex quinquefasciatus TaxID=7176 RepID=B0X7D3_CULQU|nr:zinc finger protein ZNF780A [Culex quinquefasciatus]|eukprot:XP_001865555.1 zinc finger protein ZNF780A [Culex quinquefasciatus]
MAAKLKWQQSQQRKDPIIPEPTEPLLEVFKEEPELEVLREEPPHDNPTATSQPKHEVLIEPKTEPADPTPEVAHFCALCLRPCTSGQVVEFSANPSWNCLDVPSGRDKLALLLGVDIELERCPVCRSCCIMVEMMADFREGCLRAFAWRERFNVGLDWVGDDDWLSKENFEGMARTRKVVQEHVERIKLAEIEARNRQGMDMDEMMEDEQDSVKESPPMVEIPKESQFTLEKPVIITYSCEKCQRKFETQSGMRIHFDRCKKSSNKKPNDPQLHKCSICSANFTVLSRLLEHLNKHEDIKPYKCKNESCGMDFYGKLHLYKHTERCGKIKPVCPLCGLQLSSKATLHAHMKTHASATEAPVAPVAECETCGKKFKTKKTLKNHQTVHLNEWNYPCDECGKMLKTAASLSVHRRIHMEVKPFSCAVCGQGFTLKSLVERHMQKCHAEVVLLVFFGLDCNRIEPVIVDVGLRKDFDRLIDIQNSVFVAVEEEDETHESGGPGLRGGRRDRKEPSLWRIWFIPREEEDETPSVKSSTQVIEMVEEAHFKVSGVSLEDGK